MEYKKDQIIKIALKRFAHYGFNKTTMSEIAVDLGITKANLYYYYPDKNSLVKDVLLMLAEVAEEQELAILTSYDGDLLSSLDQLLELKAALMREYYVLHISENLEWIKGQGIGSLLEEMHHKDIEMVKELFTKATERGEVHFDEVGQAAASYIQIIKGLSLIGCVADMISGMPNVNNVETILKNQKYATSLIFEDKNHIKIKSN